MIQRLIVGLFLAAAPMSAGAQQPGSPVGPATLSPVDMRLLAQSLLNDGNPAAAGEILNALLQRDPNDGAALILGAQAALDQGRPDAATVLAARAYGNAGGDVDRYVASRLAARAHAELGQDTRAQLWLRRARQYAPDAANADSVAQDYAFVRDRNPLSVDLSFGITPTNNVNNGSTADEVRIGQFITTTNAAAKPLSGVQYDAAATLRYRLSESEREATTAVFDVSTTTYTLSQSAKDALQGDIDAAMARGNQTEYLPRSGSDFAYSVVSLSLIHQRILTEGALPSTFSVGFGKSWYGGDDYQTFINAGAAHAIALGARERLNLSASLRQDFADERSAAFGAPLPAGAIYTSRDVLNIGASIGYVRALENGDLINVSLSDRISKSDDSERDYRSLQLGLAYDLARPIMNVRFGFGAQFEERKFDNSVYVDGIRRDHTVTTQVTALLDAVEYYGFKPAVTVGLGRTFSQSNRFDTQFGTVGLDVRSAF